jgi:tRNA-specific 2-thiouridylase
VARVVVGLSGGVDSSVAALLLQREGHEVIGVFMRNWEDDGDEHCPAREDLVDAAAVADVIGIGLEAVNFAAEYKERVFAYFLAEYSAGRTPNPDVLCNSEIKFRCFLDYARTLGAEHIATGHYARTQASDEGVQLLKARDRGKDQSYFLHRLTQEQLASAWFPIGALLKSEVREIARQARLPTAEKRDSTGICFIGERPFREFLERYLPKTPGDMVTTEGEVVGQHQGLAYYTLGQRQGLGIGGPGPPWFVAGKDLEHNRLVVVQGHDHPALFSLRLSASEPTWISGSPPSEDTRLAAKTRYRQADAPCVIRGLSESGFTLEFDRPQWAMTPGQSAVIYDGEQCLGGGVIGRHDVMMQA